MVQIDVHLFGCQSQVHGGHAPGAFDAQDAPVKLTIFHADWMAIHAHGVHSAGQPGGDAQGGFQRSVLNPPLVGGAARFWRRGGTPPAPAFPRRGKRERGRSNFLAAAGICLRFTPGCRPPRTLSQVLTATQKPEFPVKATRLPGRPFIISATMASVKEITELPAEMTEIFKQASKRFHFNVLGCCHEENEHYALRVVGERPTFGVLSMREIGRASCREECRSRWSPYH